MNENTFAFPHEITHLQKPLTAGMTLRDYFAAKAMQALLGCADWRENLDDSKQSPSEFTAFSAYEMANAMLKARETNA
jgi:hypothetical protein